MGISIPMQPLVTYKGAATSTTPIIQPAALWLNGQDAMETGLDILILQQAAGTGTLNLVLETSISAEGPWTPLATFTGGYCKTTKYFTAREGGTDKFQRFIRWKLDRSAPTLAEWYITFRICATVR